MILRTAILGVAFLAAAAAMLSAQQPTLQKRPVDPRVIRDPAEYSAYNAALHTEDLTQRGAALEAFTRNYPNSVAYVEAMEQAMAAYQLAGDQAKELAAGRRLLGTHPHNLRAQAIIVAIDRGIAAGGGVSAQAAIQEACPQAHRGLDELPRFQRPQNITEADFEKLRAQMTEIFAGAAGFCALQNKDYTNARVYLDRAFRINSNNLQDAYELAVADLEMNPVDTNGFWYCGKAIGLADRQSTAQSVNGIAAYCKSKYKAYHGSEDGWDGIIAMAATETVPPPDGLNIRKASTPAELAVQALKDHNAAELTISDWEFVLQYRDASSANKEAAEKVWQTIQAQEKNGQAKLKIPVKVISATQNTIHAAATNDNQKANREDLQVTMEKAMAHVPSAGSSIDVIGVIQGYTPTPFKFIMTQGELWAPVHMQLSEAEVEKLLQGGVTAKRATELVKQKGVDFSLDDAAEGRLRQAGATDELLLAIATSKK